MATQVAIQQCKNVQTILKPDKYLVLLIYTIVHIYNLQVQFLIENNLYGAEKIKLRQGPYPTSNLWHSQMAPNTLAQSFRKV